MFYLCAYKSLEKNGKSTLSYLSGLKGQRTTWDRWLDNQVIAYERSFQGRPLADIPSASE